MEWLIGRGWAKGKSSFALHFNGLSPLIRTWEDLPKRWGGYFGIWWGLAPTFLAEEVSVEGLMLPIEGVSNSPEGRLMKGMAGQGGLAASCYR
ncbi:hypothetical protein Ancab_028357 [Ancistrocladus abbreviatus]